MTEMMSDLFAILEENISRYKDANNIIASGDFNSRTGVAEDFIQYDRISDFTTNILHYLPDVNVTNRCSMDSFVNHFGPQSFCKTTSLRIVNGRYGGDPNGNITFYNANGTSLIEYVLVEDSFLTIL